MMKLASQILLSFNFGIAKPYQESGELWGRVAFMLIIKDNALERRAY
jgi:hypothetical protein